MRIKNIVTWKNPKWYVSALCLLLCAVVLVGCGLDGTNADGDGVQEYAPLLPILPDDLQNANDWVFLSYSDGVLFEHGDAHMFVSLPSGWGYRIIDYCSEQYCYGIAICPPDMPQYAMYLMVWPMPFEPDASYTKETYMQTEYDPLEVGYRNEGDVWEYIRFARTEDINYVLTCSTTNQWWDAYGDIAQGIINTTVVGQYLPDYPYELYSLFVDAYTSDGDLTALEEDQRREAAMEAASAADLKVDASFTAAVPGVYIADWEESYIGPWEEALFYAYGFSDRYGNFVYRAPGFTVEESYAIANCYIKYRRDNGLEIYKELMTPEDYAQACEDFYAVAEFEDFLAAYMESGTTSLDEYIFEHLYGWMDKVHYEWLVEPTE